jgi:hypothetical protein
VSAISHEISIARNDRGLLFHDDLVYQISIRNLGGSYISGWTCYRVNRLDLFAWLRWDGLLLHAIYSMKEEKVIRTMMMRFANIGLAWEYVHFCKANGFLASQGRDGKYYTVTTIHDSRASKRQLTAKWAEQSCQDHGPPSRGRQLELFNE